MIKLTNIQLKIRIYSFIILKTKKYIYINYKVEPFQNDILEIGKNYPFIDVHIFPILK